MHLNIVRVYGNLIRYILIRDVFKNNKILKLITKYRKIR